MRLREYNTFLLSFKPLDIRYNSASTSYCCRAKDSENIDFPGGTAWTIATKKNFVQINENIPLLLW